MSSTVKLNRFKLLEKSQLIPANKYSEKSYTVNDCNPRQSAVIPLHFHCSFTVTIYSAVICAVPLDHPHYVFND